MQGSVNSRVLFVTLILSLTFWWAFVVRTEQHELERSEEALRHVSSWRQKMLTGSGSKLEVEMVCSGGKRSIRSKQDNPRKRTIPCDKLMRGESAYPLPNFDYLIENTI